MWQDGADRPPTVLPGADLTTVTFDANGNLTGQNLAGSLTTNRFDNENRLIGMQNPDGTRSTYTSAGDGLRRTGIEPRGAVTTMVWDGADCLGEI